MKISRILPLLAVSLSSLAISPRAYALTFLESSTASFSQKVTELNGTPLLTLNKYSGSVPLSQVVLTFNAAVNSSGTVRNTASQAQSFNVTLSVDEFDIKAQPGSPSVLLGKTYSPFDSTSGIIGRGEYTLLAPSVNTAFGAYTLNAPTKTVTFNSNLSGFSGGGTFSFAPITEIDTSTSGSKVKTSITTLADASVTVSYYAAAVPFNIPGGATIPAVGSLIALGAIRKARKTIHQKTVSPTLL